MEIIVIREKQKATMRTAPTSVHLVGVASPTYPSTTIAEQAAVAFMMKLWTL
jgi:hypothetical protein